MAIDPDKLVFFGGGYNEDLDRERLTTQIERLANLMLDGTWRTLREISSAISAPEASVSAGLRALRRKAVGGHKVDKRRRGNPKQGLWEYQLIWNVDG